MIYNVAPVDKDLVIQKGMSRAYEVRITKDDVVEDITGWTIIFMVKKNLTDSDAEAVINKTITAHSDPTQGKSLIRLNPTDTDIPARSYYYSIKFIDNESPANKGVIVRGRLTIERVV